MGAHPRQGRPVRVLEVPTGPAVLELLPDLERALSGAGTALLPLSASDPRSAAIATALRAGEPLCPAEDDPDDPTALIMATSGSTGPPKGVLLPAGTLIASSQATEHRLGGPGSWLLALPAQHIAGMQVLLRAAAAGTEPIVLDTAEPFTATRFAAAAALLRGARRYVSLVPTQLQRVLADPEATGIAKEVFDAVLVGGSAISAALLRTASAAGIAVVTTYGMTETCGGCVYDGRPLDGVSVTVNAAGALVLTGPVVGRGYRSAPDDPAFAAIGSFVTADTGVIGADGTVRIVGRLDEVIVTGGVKVPPVVVEAALVALPGIAAAVVVGVPDEQWGQAVTAVLVPAEDDPPDLVGVRGALSGLPAAYRPRRLVLTDAIPQLPSGKPDRRAAADLAAPIGRPLASPESRPLASPETQPRRPGMRSSS